MAHNRCWDNATAEKLTKYCDILERVPRLHRCHFMKRFFYSRSPHYTWQLRTQRYWMHRWVKASGATVHGGNKQRNSVFPEGSLSEGTSEEWVGSSLQDKQQPNGTPASQAHFRKAGKGGFSQLSKARLGTMRDKWPRAGDTGAALKLFSKNLIYEILELSRIKGENKDVPMWMNELSL